MAILKNGKVTIDYIDQNGSGVGFDEGKKIELPFVLPEEFVAYQTHQYRGKTNSLPKEILITSKERIVPECEYFSFCGGCMLQHMNRDHYRKYKQDSLNKQLVENEINASSENIEIFEAGIRRKTKLYMVLKQENVFLGYYQRLSNKIVNIDKCLVILPELNRLILPLKDFCQSALPDRTKADIYLMQVSNGIDILFEFEQNIELCSEFAKLCQLFAEQNDVIRFSTRIMGEERIIYKKETPYITYGDFMVETKADSFMQTSFNSEKYIQQFVLDNIEGGTKLKIADLFCGRGALSMQLADRHQIDGFEIDQAAVDAANEVTKACSTFNAYIRNLFSEPLSEKIISNYDAIIINPPRAGAIEQIKQIAISKAKKIIYISCSIDSFARDAKILIKEGYKIDILQPLDQFYWNQHLEILASFTK